MHRFNLRSRAWHALVFDHLKQTCSPLSDVAGAYFGLQTYDRNKYVSTTQQNTHWRPCVNGADLGPMQTATAHHFVSTHPDAIKSGGKATIQMQRRLGVRQIGEVPVVGVIDEGVYSLNTVYNVYLHCFSEPMLMHLLGWLNTGITKWFWHVCFADFKRTFPKIKKGPLLTLPVPPIDNATPQWFEHIDYMRQLKPGTALWTDAQSTLDDMAMGQLALPHHLSQKLKEAVLMMYDGV